MVIQNLYKYEASLLKSAGSQDTIDEDFGATDAAIRDAEETYEP